MSNDDSDRDATPGNGAAHGHPGGVPVSRPDGTPVTDVSLTTVLTRSRELGFLGPGPVEAHVRNAEAFLPGLDRWAAVDVAAGPNRPVLLDLGSGGGVPGLVLALQRPGFDVVLVDAAQRRTEFLTWAVEELGLEQRVRVVRGRAEELARATALRGTVDVVTSRSFGPPPVTAECAVGFLRGPGSVLLVSEPPDADPDRWPAEPLAHMGLRPGTTWSLGSATVRALDVVADCPPELPRRVGVPSRRPAF